MPEAAPFMSDPQALARLTTPRPGAVEADSSDPCAWCWVPLGEGAQHVRPVSHQGFFYGSPACAAAAVESGAHADLVALSRQVAAAPHLILRTSGAAR